MAVAMSMAAVVGGLMAYSTYQAESFGDRRLDRPTPDECAVARLVLARLAPERPELLRKVGAPDERLELLAFAWFSTGTRAGRGADWRGCRGLGPFVRGLGMARLNSGGRGPSLYISRLSLGRDRLHGAAWITLFAPVGPGEWASSSERAPTRIWRAEITRTTASWRLAGLTPAS